MTVRSAWEYSKRCDGDRDKRSVYHYFWRITEKCCFLQFHECILDIDVVAEDERHI